jgi:hypothetical protein
MKYLIFAIGVIIFSCGQKNEREWLPNGRPTLPQVFDIDANRDTTLVGSNGTILKFKAKSFQTNTGEDVQGKIELRVQEFFTKWDFVKNRLSTNTVDGKLLQSSGMLFIQASSDTSTLSLKNDRAMTIMFPRIVNSRTANLFTGQKGPNDEVRWSLLESVHNDTLVIKKETIESRRFGGETVTVELKFVIGDDTIELNPDNQRDFAKVLSRLPRNDEAFDSVRTELGAYDYKYDTEFRFYVFQTTNLGFINCDIFINMELYDLTVNLDNAESDVFIIIDSLNSVLYPDSAVKKTNDYIFSIPRDLEISIVAYRKENDRYYLGIERVKSTTSKVTIRQSEKPLDKINQDIERLSENAR